VELIGPIIGLQVQRSSLKLGERPRRWFDPAPLTLATELAVGASGLIGLPAESDPVSGGPVEPVVDIHNRDHPASRYGSNNAISLGFTSHYARMRDRLGPLVTDGIAGENIIVQTVREYCGDDLPRSLAIEGADGLIYLEGIRPIEPCVEFSRFVLGHTGPPGHDVTQPDPAVTDTLTFLRHGTRGYYAAYVDGATVLRAGDRLLAF